MKFLDFLPQKALYRIVLALVVLAFVLVNTCAGLVSEKFGVRLDMTGEKLYALSAVTKEIASSLEQPVSISVICNQNDYPAMLREVLGRYEKLSDKLAVRYVDPYASPKLLDHYRQLGYTLAESDVLVEGAAGIKQISAGDMLVYRDGEPYGIQVEQQISGALLYVNNPEKRTAAFTTGHNERRSNALEKLFSDNNFVVESVYLGTGQPVEADIVVVPSPARDFTAGEISALEKYLSGGGKLMVFLEPGVGDYPELGAFLADWNLSAPDNVVFEERAFVSDNPVNLVPRYAPHEINTYFTDNQYYVVMPSAREIKVNSGGLGAVRSKAVLLSTPEAYAKSGTTYGSAAREASDAAGPFTLAAVTEKDVATARGGASATVFLAGSRYLYADDIMGTPSYANREFLTQVIGYLSGGSRSISIPAKTLAAPAVPIRLHQSIAVGAVLVLLLPLGVLAAGITVYVKRKNR